MCRCSAALSININTKESNQTSEVQILVSVSVILISDISQIMISCSPLYCKQHNTKVSRKLYNVSDKVYPFTCFMQVYSENVPVKKSQKVHDILLTSCMILPTSIGSSQSLK